MTLITVLKIAFSLVITTLKARKEWFSFKNHISRQDRIFMANN